MIPDHISRFLNENQKHFLEDFFLGCDASFFDQALLKTYPSDHVLIDTDDSCTYVYILLQGRLQAIEEHMVHEPYCFTEISAIEIAGDFELFTNTPARMVTLTTLEKSLCLVLPASFYFSWMKHNAHALFIRTQMLIRQFISQGQFERQNFFLDNQTRMLLLLSRECQKTDSVFPVRLSFTRPVLAARLGCSVRTVNRTIQRLEQNRLISVVHGKIAVSSKQLELIRKLLEKTAY